MAGKLPAVIISADGWDQPDVPLPIRADQGRLTVNGTSADGKPDTLTLAPELRYGALQAFHDGRRSLLGGHLQRRTRPSSMRCWGG